jgi:chemotaxis protein methyltransferase CheR
MNSVYLAMAKAGAYEYRSLRELPSNFAEKYFHKLSGKKLYFVDSRLKERITFREHNIIQEPPPSVNFSLVFLRNSLLTYYRSPQKTNTLNRVIAAMQAGAVMIVGSHEKLSEVSHLMAPSVHSPWIYNKLP